MQAPTLAAGALMAVVPSRLQKRPYTEIEFQKNSAMVLLIWRCIIGERYKMKLIPGGKALNVLGWLPGAGGGRQSVRHDGRDFCS